MKMCIDQVTLDDLGKRICIMGRSCAGKSTLAYALHKRLGLPILHLDRIAHIPNTNWERRPHDDFLKSHQEFIDQNNYWVIDGNYSACITERLEKASSVIFLDFAVFNYFWHYMLRSIQSILQPQHRIGAIKGAKKEFNWDMIQYVYLKYSNNSLKYHKFLDEYMQDKPVLVLNKFTQLNDLYKSLGVQQ